MTSCIIAGFECRLDHKGRGQYWRMVVWDQASDQMLYQFLGSLPPVPYLRPSYDHVYGNLLKLGNSLVDQAPFIAAKLDAHGIVHVTRAHKGSILINALQWEGVEFRFHDVDLDEPMDDFCLGGQVGTEVSYLAKKCLGMERVGK